MKTITLTHNKQGEVCDDTTFYYSQKDNIISAKYSGGEIVKGNLIGKQLKDGRFDFVYHHTNTDGDLKIGKCLSSATLLENDIHDFSPIKNTSTLSEEQKKELNLRISFFHKDPTIGRNWDEIKSDLES